MLTDTDRARKAIQMLRDNPRTSYLDFAVEFHISIDQAKLLYGNIMISDEL